MLFPEFEEFDWRDEWKDMPEFVQEDLMPWRTLYVHFEDQEDLNQFIELTGYNITDLTRFVWFPEVEPKKLKNKRYSDIKEET